MSEVIKVASKRDIPEGESKIVQAKDKEIALFNVGGKFHAIDNLCPHRGGPLGEGLLEGNIVACPWHGWQFDVTTGALVMNPAEKLRTFAVQVKGEDIFVEI
jgi:NAD(P)H-dependent nitrite reductase small subunit